jgi:hypothetical protein
MPQQRSKGSLTSGPWQDFSPPISTATAQQSSNYASRRPPPQTPQLHVVSQFVPLSATVSRPRSLRLRFPRANRKSSLAPDGQVNGVPSHTVEHYGPWCVYDGEMYLRSRVMLMLRPAACSLQLVWQTGTCSGCPCTAYQCILKNVISTLFLTRRCAYLHAIVIADSQVCGSC